MWLLQAKGLLWAKFGLHGSLMEHTETPNCREIWKKPCMPATLANKLWKWMNIQTDDINGLISILPEWEAARRYQKWM